MNNDTKCCSWLRKRPTGQKQSRGKFACCKITSEAGRSNATFAAHGTGHDEHPRLGRKSFFSARERASRAESPQPTDSCLCQKCHRNRIATKTQPMIPAHDRSGLRVFAGTWQSPANL